MHFHAGPYAGSATQQTRSSPASPLQILPFCKKIIRSTALLNHLFARPSSLCPSCWECWTELCHMCWVFAIAKHCAFIILQGGQVPLTTLEVLWKDSNRDLRRVGHLARLPTINQAINNNNPTSSFQSKSHLDETNTLISISIQLRASNYQKWTHWYFIWPAGGEQPVEVNRKTLDNQFLSIRY